MNKVIKRNLTFNRSTVTSTLTARVDIDGETVDVEIGGILSKDLTQSELDRKILKSAQSIVAQRAAQKAETDSLDTVLATLGADREDYEIIPSKLVVSPISLDFGTSRVNLSLEITNPGLPLKFGTATREDWITITTTTGPDSDGNATLNVNIDRTGLPDGVSNGTIFINSIGDGGSVAVPVTATVTP